MRKRYRRREGGERHAEDTGGGVGIHPIHAGAYSGLLYGAHVGRDSADDCCVNSDEPANHLFNRSPSGGRVYTVTMVVSSATITGMTMLRRMSWQRSSDRRSKYAMPEGVSVTA